MKQITTYTEAGRTFVICQDTEKRFWAFEDKYIDASGRLTKQFNGISGKMSKTLKETLLRVREQIAYDEYIKHGIEKYTATQMAIEYAQR